MDTNANVTATVTVAAKRTRTTEHEQRMDNTLVLVNTVTGSKFVAIRSDEKKYYRALFDLYNDKVLIRTGLTVTEVELITTCYMSIEVTKPTELPMAA